MRVVEAISVDLSEIKAACSALTIGTSILTVEYNKKPLKVLFVHLNFEPGLFCYTAGVSFLPGNPLKVLRLPDFHLIGYPGKFMKVKCNNIRDVCPFVLSVRLNFS